MSDVRDVLPAARPEDAAETGGRGVVAQDPGLVLGDAAGRDRVERPGGGRRRGKADGGGGVSRDVSEKERTLRGG